MRGGNIRGGPASHEHSVVVDHEVPPAVDYLQEHRILLPSPMGPFPGAVRAFRVPSLHIISFPTLQLSLPLCKRYPSCHQVLRSLLNSAGAGSVLLLEDVDAAFSRRQAGEVSTGLTFSGETGGMQSQTG